MVRRRPLPDWVLAEMTTLCYVCNEVKAGQNLREYAFMRNQAESLIGAGITRAVRRLAACGLCARVICDHHCSYVWPRDGAPAIRCCRECRALKYRLCGLGGYRDDVKKTSFRQQWRLFRWRVTKRRLVDRLRIGRVVERQLPKDVANLVATYAVK